MNKNIFFFIVFFFFTISNVTDNIVYLDIQFIIDNSELGKFYKKKILQLQDKTKQDLKTEETLIKNKETEINNKKNILKQDELDKKIIELNQLLKNYQFNRKKFNDDTLKNKQKYSNKILKVLNPLLTEYVEKNNITLVIEKKNILVGIKTLDITKNILDILNDETLKKKLTNEN